PPCVSVPYLPRYRQLPAPPPRLAPLSPFSFLTTPPHPTSTLFPYTTLFRSSFSAAAASGSAQATSADCSGIGFSRNVTCVITPKIGRAHVLTPVTDQSRMPSSA